MIEFYDLNARHEATLLWILIPAALATAINPQIRTSLCGIARTLMHGGLLLWLSGLFLTVLLATIAAVWLGRIVGFWEVLPVVGALSWFLISGIGILMQYDRFLDGESVLKFSVKLVSPAAGVTAVMSVSTLPLPWEGLIFPVVSVLSMLIAYMRAKEPSGGTYALLAVPLSLYVVLSLALAIYRLIDDLSVGQSIVESLLLPIWLALPALLYVRFLVTWERSMFLRGAAKKTVAPSDYGDKWPLTVGAALLCAKDNAVWIEANGKRYRLNGTADGALRRLGIGLAEIREIQRVDDEFMERFADLLDLEESDPHMMSVHPLIRDGLTLGSTRRI